MQSLIEQEANQPSIKRLLRLAIPIALGMASLSILGLVETVILGHYSQEALAASASVNYIFFVYLSAFAGFAIAVQTQVARNKDTSASKQNNRQATLTGLLQLLLLAFIFIGFSYGYHHQLISAQLESAELVQQASDFLLIKSWSLLPIAILMAFRGFWHGSNRPKLLLLCLLISHVSAGILCYLLVFGKLGLPELGLKGSAIATVAGMSLGTLILTLYSVKPLQLLPFKRNESIINWRQFKHGWHLAWPTSLQQVIFAVGMAVFMALIAKTSVTQLAAAHLLVTLSLVLILPVVGLGMAATTFISHSYGHFLQGKTDAATVNKWYKITLLLSLSTVLIFGVIIISATETLLYGLTDDQSVVDTAFWPMIILVPSLLFEAFTISTKQSLYAIHQNQAVLKVLGITQWGLLLPPMLIVYLMGVGSLELYTLLHAGQRAINSVWLYRIWKRKHCNYQSSSTLP